MHLTDQQLLELIETKPPEELTLAEIDQLRRRLTQSTELQEALAGRLSMDRYLADALGRVDVSVDGSSLARATPRRCPRVACQALVGGTVCVVLLIFVGIVLVLAVTVPPGKRDADDKVAQLNPVPRKTQSRLTARTICRRTRPSHKMKPGKKPAAPEAQPTTDKPFGEKPADPASPRILRRPRLSRRPQPSPSRKRNPRTK